LKDNIIAGKTITEWKKEYPLMKDIMEAIEVFWINPKLKEFDEAIEKISLKEEDVEDAEARLLRFAPFITKHFPETYRTEGIIESSLVEVSEMQKALEEMSGLKIPGNMLLKLDSHLPISGSIKARGGIYEVLKHTEDLALEHGLIALDDDYSIMADEKHRDFFNRYVIQVGSTGNLGLSIGIMSVKIGYKVVVHMSSDAKKWKKDMLRSEGVEVREYESDYSKAVEEGRKLSDADSMSYFVDDENSKDLFLGYSVAAGRLKKQLDELDIIVDDDHPLFVYLPCGVGGGPGGVAFGLKLLFKDNVHCFFAEPTHSPCMLLGMMTGKHNEVSVFDYGIDNITEADGLAVGRPSGFVGKTMDELLSGIYTVDDEILYVLLSTMIQRENIRLEPSACACIPGPLELIGNEETLGYLRKHNLEGKMENAVHIIWATGGSMVPDSVMDGYHRRGKALISKISMSNISFKKISEEDMNESFLHHFNRYQEVSHVWRMENNKKTVKDVDFIEDWDDTEKQGVIKELIEVIDRCGTVFGAFDDKNLIGFASVDGRLIGKENEYIQMLKLFVSQEYRGRGIGVELFDKCAESARKAGARKLYISSNSSIETVGFYEKMGCADATWLYEKQVELEPYDCQMEFRL
jgi:D-serine dehydratase